MGKIRVTQVRKGKRITFLTKDKGKPGKTPKGERWFEPGIETGWEKDQPESERRAKILDAHKGDELASARAMQALSNVTTDRKTKRLTRADALHFYRLHQGKQKRVSSRRPVRITPRRPRLKR